MVCQNDQKEINNKIFRVTSALSNCMCLGRDSALNTAKSLSLLPPDKQDQNINLLTKHDVSQIEDYFDNNNTLFESYFSNIMFLSNAGKEDDIKV